MLAIALLQLAGDVVPTAYFCTVHAPALWIAAGTVQFASPKMFVPVNVWTASEVESITSIGGQRSFPSDPAIAQQSSLRMVSWKKEKLVPAPKNSNVDPTPTVRR